MKEEITEDTIESVKKVLDTLEEVTEKIKKLSSLGSIRDDELIFDLEDTDWTVMIKDGEPVLQYWDEPIASMDRTITGYSDLGEEMRTLKYTAIKIWEREEN